MPIVTQEQGKDHWIVLPTKYQKVIDHSEWENLLLIKPMIEFRMSNLKFSINPS